MRRIDLKKASAARSNTIRDINRQIVLNYVRELGPISRAEIARETALQRSTVSLIVDELTADGLIEELDDRPAPEDDDVRRRYYRITRLGRKAATEESGRLAALLRHARALGFAPKTL